MRVWGLRNLVYEDAGPRPDFANRERGGGGGGGGDGGLFSLILKHG